eukprot:gene13884-14004_t
MLSKTGGLESLEVQGTMSLVVGSEADAYVNVKVGLKDPSRPFPTGSELGVLKWRFQSRDESLVPLSINCWPSASGSQSYVNIE